MKSEGVIRVICAIWFTAIKRDAMNASGWNFFDSIILLTASAKKIVKD